MLLLLITYVVSDTGLMTDLAITSWMCLVCYVFFFFLPLWIVLKGSSCKALLLLFCYLFA
ncbi:hypothetical protein BO70DRAFT_119263 [Aspergillus heteromorphus CBS 117.55]|uniref:Uncharacterized protein n=1 Tax=Aspergillus heteromorphus CBS 117.55 TaxID=1448321 RepID=A0A317VF87_9EURO|nr:uncharacterized protein BO70DRAFT_119263 [Aspergillus heteromorphus CBS 117.55]PWY71618.1 hypothetical protein BO70DRAFT_119263 [Aspergillus heteromorphus CBS 117.55]